jgi:hypothetical protein
VHHHGKLHHFTVFVPKVANKSEFATLVRPKKPGKKALKNGPLAQLVEQENLNLCAVSVRIDRVPVAAHAAT